jgi:DNA-binding transcriptional MerR regulator
MQAEHYHTSGSVAKTLGIPRWQLAYFIERGIVPDASFHVPGRKLFTADDVKQIRRALAERKNSRRMSKQEAGYNHDLIDQ